jgi:hypothetical protein
MSPGRMGYRSYSGLLLGGIPFEYLLPYIHWPFWLKSSVLWDMTPCRQFKVDRSFGVTYRFHDSLMLRPSKWRGQIPYVTRKKTTLHKHGFENVLYILPEIFKRTLQCLFRVIKTTLVPESCERAIPTEGLSAKLAPTFADRWVSRSQCDGSLMP